MRDLNLENILAVREWEPLSEVSQRLPGVRLDDDIFRIEGGGYFRLTPWNDLTLEVRAGGPFVSGFLWAADDSAMRRVVRMDFEHDRNIVVPVPPRLLPLNAEATYASIKDHLVDLAGGPPMETGWYRITTDGAFVYRSLWGGGKKYYFRSRLDDPKEAPFAIDFNLV